LTVDLTDPAVAAAVARHHHLFEIRGDRAAIRLEDLDRLDQATLSQLRHTDLSGLAAVIAGLFMAVVVAIFIFTFVQNLIMELAGHRIMHDLRVGPLPPPPEHAPAILHPQSRGPPGHPGHQ
jgi:hypothetical protein